MPGVLVNEQHALAIDVTVAFLQIGFEHPHTPQLIAHVIRVRVIDGQQVGVFGRARVGLVGIGRDVHLTLADQFPGETLRRAVVQAIFVHRHGAIGANHRLVIAIPRQLAHAAGRGAVGPGLTRVGLEVVGLVGNVDHPIVPCRLEGGVVGVGLQLVFGARFHGR